MRNQMRLSKAKNILTAHFQGEIDNTNIISYKEQLGSVLDRDQGINLLIFNFSAISFIDSAGLGLILGRYNQMKGRRGNLTIVGASSHVKKLLLLSGLGKILTFNQEEVYE